MELQKLANRILSSYKAPQDISYEDLIQSALVGILEAQLRWDENSGCSFTTMAYRYAYNELNNLIYKQTTRSNLPCRVSRNKEVPIGLDFEHPATEDTSYQNALVNEVFKHAEDILTREEYYMFKELYHHGDKQATSSYQEKYSCSYKKANRVKHSVREKMQGAINANTD